MAHKKTNYIPRKNADFMDWLEQYEEGMDELMALPGVDIFSKRAKDKWKDELKPAIDSCKKAWDKAKDKSSRSHAHVIAFSGGRSKLGERQKCETKVRAFNKEFVLFNTALSLEQKADLGLTTPDTEPTTHRTQITAAVYFTATPIGGGDLQIRVRGAEDTKRASILRGSNAFQVRWKELAAGENPPNNVSALQEFSLPFTKAISILKIGTQSIGARIVLSCRWVVSANQSLNGPWSNMQIVVLT